MEKFEKATNVGPALFLARSNLSKFVEISPEMALTCPMNFQFYATLSESPDIREIFQSVAGWSSLVARQAHNLKVPGSNPGPAPNEGPAVNRWAFAI